MNREISIVIPAYNEQEALKGFLPVLREQYKDVEIVVVDDSSDDNTVDIAKQCGADIVISHTYNMGNGATIKTGARTASGKYLVFMDADGQHRPEDIGKLLEKMNEGYDMVVGARNNSGHASLTRFLGNRFYNWLASIISGHQIIDLTSGFRVVRADYFRRFLYLLPNGFSYPSSITMAFFRAGYSVAYVPVEVMQRKGKSHLRVIRDGIRFLLIIFKIGTLYSPLKIFAPVSLFFFISGVCYYAYTFYTMSRFTNMSALLFIVSILVFLIGLVSEQITALMYSAADRDDSVKSRNTHNQ